MRSVAAFRNAHYGKKPPILIDGSEGFTQRLREGSRPTVRPFRRVLEVFAVIRHALSPLEEQSLAHAGVPPYSSRGHGQALLGNKHSRHTVAMDKRAARKARNKRR